MKYKTYASIYIGTYETSMQIMEIHPTGNNLLRLIDDKRMPIALYHDRLMYGRLSPENRRLLFETLSDMMDTITSYKVDHYDVFASYITREMKDFHIMKDRIDQIIKKPLRILSNSEQRFFSYGALANQREFDEIISESALIVDVGGSSLQFTLFEDGEMITSQHILLGASQVRENLARLSEKPDGQAQLSEMIYKEIDTFAHMFFPDMSPKYLVVSNDTFRSVLSLFEHGEDGLILSGKKSLEIVDKFLDPDYFLRISKDYQLSDPDGMLVPFILLYHAIVKKVHPESVMIPGVSVHDGFTWAFAQSNNIIKPRHDFEKDILSASWQIAKRFDSYKPHLKMLDNLSCAIFDALKKQQGLLKRHRVLLRVACILHDCGKYISLSSAGESTYAIIMSSEIIGLTHDERQLIACVCSHIHGDYIGYDSISEQLPEEDYIIFLKLLAILRVANALDRSHKQKLRDVKISKKEKIEYNKEFDETKAHCLEKTKDFAEALKSLSFGIAPQANEMCVSHDGYGKGCLDYVAVCRMFFTVSGDEGEIKE